MELDKILGAGIDRRKFLFNNVVDGTPNLGRESLAPMWLLGR
jgi:hypothetical protein